MYYVQLHNNKVTGASKIAQKVKVPATRPADLSVIPRSHVVAEENRFPQMVWSTHACYGTRICTQVHTYAYKEIDIKQKSLKLK